MVFLGFGKYVRADRIFALAPIVGEQRGNGQRTMVWVEGLAEPVTASRTQDSIVQEMAESETRPRVPRTGQRALVQHPSLFPAEPD